MPAIISAAVLVRDAEQDLARALQSLVPWVDEVVVVDGRSRDQSTAVARSFGAKVLVRPPASSIDSDRAAAIEACKGDWIMHLDSDEVVPPALGQRLRSIAESDKIDVVEVRDMSFFIGQPSMRSGHGVRLFRRSAVTVRDKVHHPFQVHHDARVVRIGQDPKERLVHYWTDGTRQLLARTGRYALNEADHSSRPVPTGGKMLWHAVRAFLRSYLGGKGHRHGWRGMYLSLHAAFYEATVDAAAAELALGGSTAIRAGYHAHADTLLAK